MSNKQIAASKQQITVADAERVLAYICKIWHLISRTVSEDDAHRGNIDDRSVRAFAVKPRAFGAPLCGVGA